MRQAWATVALLLILVVGVAHAASEPVSAAAASPKSSPDGAGRPLPNEGNVDGFGGMLLVTPDADWQAKWDTPPETKPNFNSTDRVGEGGRLWVLPFFNNPAVDAQGQAHVLADLQVVRPDGSIAHHPDQLCLKGAMPRPTLVYLCSAAIAFEAQASDPRGAWRVRITLRDLNRGVALPLETSFTYE